MEFVEFSEHIFIPNLISIYLHRRFKNKINSFYFRIKIQKYLDELTTRDH